MLFTLAGLLIVITTVAGCGYHTGGRAVTIPGNIHTLAVPAFKNETQRFKVEQVLTQAVVRELLARTKYRVQPETSGSDAVLSGTVTQFWSTPVVVEPAAGRSIAVAVSVRARVKLTDSRTGKVLYDNADFTFNETYEVSGDAATYFEESGAAMQRLSRAFAGSLVSSVLEAF